LGIRGPSWWLNQREPLSTDVLADGGIAGSYDGKSWSYAGRSPVQFAEERIAFGPERVLLTADDAFDLRTLSDERMNGSPFHRLSFSWRGASCILTINARTNLPWSIAWTRAYPFDVFYNAWGDVDTTLTYNGWTLEPGGIHYPREWTYERVGLPDRQMAIIALSFNDAASGAMTLPPSLIAAHAVAQTVDDAPFARQGETRLAEGVTLIPGAWNVAFIAQSDGVVMIEAPISGGYVQQALAYAGAHFRLPVKAVITTSDSWPHIAGVREAVARGIAVYALDLNQPILLRLLAAPHRLHPDELQRRPRAPRFVWVGAPLQVDDRQNPLRIVPYRTATGERQMMVYLPKAHLLYTSDLFAPDAVNADGTARTWFTPQYLDEAITAIDREKLGPVTVWGMHYGPTPYSQLLKARAL